ncbi:MAG: peptide ABC transporter substrate-binding protein [Planctomycetota bacterium]|nr:MAG: peptide ABC transporter substrate-binding protein [Planctomycetota bacterium]
MTRDRARDGFLLLLFALLILSALSAVRGTMVERADFTFTNNTEVQSLDPATVSGVPEGRVLRGLFEGLTVEHPKTLEPLPGMAESWTVSEDGQTLRFRIRAEACWSDGRPLTAEDFVWSWKRLLQPRTAAKYYELLFYVKGAKSYFAAMGAWEKAGAEEAKRPSFDSVGIRAPESHLFEVELSSPVPFFLSLTSFYPLFPVPRHVVEGHGRDWHRPGSLVNNGPFLLQQRTLRDRIRMTRNPRYWDRDRVKIETIDVLPVESLVSALNLYLSGDVDWIPDVPATVLAELSGREDFQSSPYLGVYFYRINMQNKDPVKRRFFGDLRVRQALALTIDRAAICRSVTRAGEIPAYDLTPPGLGAYSGPQIPREDSEKAKSLLAAALADLGLEKAPSFTILYNTHELHKDIAEVVQSQWSRKLGLDVRLENQEWGSYMTSMQSLGYDVARSAWIGDYPDPNTFLDMWTKGNTNNRTGWTRPEFDALLARANHESDAAKRLSLLAEAEAMILSDLPVIPIYYYVTKNMVRPGVQGFYPNVLNVHPLKFLWMQKPSK